MSDPTELSYHPPDAFELDEAGHVRSTPAAPSEPLIRNIRELGRLIQPVHARRVDGNLRVFDGWRRVQACREIGIDVATLIYEGLSDVDATVKSLKLNDKGAGIAKTVTDNDREKSLMALVTGEERTAAPWETDTGEIHEARYRIGLDGEEDRLQREIGNVDGVGPATVAALIDHFGDTESVLDADRSDLQDATGVGPKTAAGIREAVDRDTPEVVTHVEDNNL